MSEGAVGHDAVGQARSDGPLGQAPSKAPRDSTVGTTQAIGAREEEDSSPSPLDLDALLGLTPADFKPERRKVPREPKPLPAVECGQSPPKERPTNLWSDAGRFTFQGYVARVTRYECQCCSNLWDHLQGIFMAEAKENGTRRLQAIAPNGDWPAQGPHTKEVTDVSVPWCGGCIGDLGFSREVNTKGEPYTLTIHHKETNHAPL